MEKDRSGSGENSATDPAVIKCLGKFCTGNP